MQRKQRRHESLIPLSREHQYALLLCLRIRQDVAQADAHRLPQRAAAVVRFFEEDLTLHFQAEEEALFPALRNWPADCALLDELEQEHRVLTGLVEALRCAGAASVAGLLVQFADCLEAHLRKEERALFPMFEQQVTAELARQIGQEITRTIGAALQPRHPELLR
jgi:iron-sulfur cluster repair protein YtfE (RIC family)